MDPTMTAASKALARVNIVSELLSLDMGRVIALVNLAGSGLARFARVSLDHRFKEPSVTAELPASDERAVLIEELTRRDQLFGERVSRWIKARPSSPMFVEFRGEQKLSTQLGIYRQRNEQLSISAQLNALATITHAGEAVESLRSIVESDIVPAGGVVVGLLDSFTEPAHHSWTLRGALAPEIDEKLVLGPLFEKFEINKAQRGLLGTMHSVLRRGGRTEFGLRIGPGVVYPELTLYYRRIEVDLLIRLIIGLNLNRDPGTNLGQFLGAMGSRDQLGQVAMTLAKAGPTVRFGAILVDGEPAK